MQNNQLKKANPTGFIKRMINVVMHKAILRNKPMFMATHIMTQPENIAFEQWEMMNETERLAHMDVLPARVLMKGKSDIMFYAECNGGTYIELYNGRCYRLAVPVKKFDAQMKQLYSAEIINL